MKTFFLWIIYIIKQIVLFTIIPILLLLLSIILSPVFMFWYIQRIWWDKYSIDDKIFDKYKLEERLSKIIYFFNNK